MVPWCSRLQGFLVFLRPFASVMTAHVPSAWNQTGKLIDMLLRTKTLKLEPAAFRW